MAEYIDREAVLEIVNKYDITALAFGQKIRNLPAADVAPVRHARWIKNSFLSDDITTAGECSECGEIIGWFSKLPNYCPHCGAKMDGGNNDAAD